MKPNFNYADFPASFAHCFREHCLRGDKCLRRQIALRAPKERVALYSLNPVYLDTLGDQGCPFFKLDEPQQFAKGITCLYDDVPLRKAQLIKSQIIAHLGRSTYYRCKQKRRLIRPKEQAYIKKLFLANGISTEPRYDEYQEYYDLE